MEQKVSCTATKIGNIPAVLYGETTDKVYLYLHGQGGNKADAAALAAIACPTGWQVLSVDLPGHGERVDSDNFFPWIVVPELHQVYEALQSNYKYIALCANSIGAWFSLLAFAKEPIVQALFISPVLDMERLIQNMMKWAGVTSEQLEKEKTISTNFGQTLSWDYLTWVQQHPILQWKHPTKILYAGQDNLVEREVVEQFVSKFGAELTVMENGEHWFHTDEQLETMANWFKNSL